MESAGDLQSHQERQYLLEDFTNLHHYSLQQAMASAIHVANPPFDFRKQIALICLSYCPESAGNPSTAFKLTSAQFMPNPPPDSPMGVNFAAFQPLIDESDREDRGKPGYQGVLLCSYITDDQFIGRLTALVMFESHMCREIRKHDDWFDPLKYKLDKGLVFRFPHTKGGWKPGMMKKEGKNWVWKEKSFEELREDYDIHLLSAPHQQKKSFEELRESYDIHLLSAPHQHRKSFEELRESYDIDLRARQQ